MTLEKRDFRIKSTSSQTPSFYSFHGRKTSPHLSHWAKRRFFTVRKKAPERKNGFRKKTRWVSQRYPYAFRPKENGVFMQNN
jgi:hypothetical protein